MARINEIYDDMLKASKAEQDNGNQQTITATILINISETLALIYDKMCEIQREQPEQTDKKTKKERNYVATGRN